MSKTIDLKNCFLTRCYPDGVQPFSSIMDLSEDEANKLTEEFTGKKSSEGVGYFAHRKLVESWLRTEAKNVGAQINHRNPLYFTLTDHPTDSTSDNGINTIALLT